MARSVLSLSWVALFAHHAFGGNPPPQTCEAGESPDIMVAEINAVARWGNVGGITAYSFGVQFCNQGDCWLNFFHNTNQHPVVGHNLYRLKDGRFEQIGLSWLQHGFFALSQNTCFNDCQPTDGTHLGTHCADVSSASMQGQQNNLGPRSQINPASGGFLFPFTAPPAPATIGRRLQVHDADLDAVSNPGALYFVESQFIAPDDALAGNGGNNASHRRVNIGPAPAFNISLTGSSVRELPAIHAWKANDPQVVETLIDVTGDGRFILAARATDLGGGQWGYEYALHNLNSHRAAGSFAVPLPSGIAVSGLGFHDVDYHSGEPFDSADWDAVADAASITWSTQPFAENENANALRWGTLYNFRFVAAAPPGEGEATVGLFRPGTTGLILAETVVPIVAAPAAAVVSAVSRGPNASGGAGMCDLPAWPARGAEPRSAGITELHVGFNLPIGSPSTAGIVLEEAKCGAPGFAAYSGISVIGATAEESGLALSFTPALENGKTYKITLGPPVTSLAGQIVELRALVGDVNGDGLVNALDRSVLVGVWTGAGFSCASDLNADGQTNALDRSVAVGAWTGPANCAP